MNRTFGCVRLVWNKTLAERSRRYHAEGARTSYRETDAALTAWKRADELAFLSEVSCVPLQQTLRHQHTAFGKICSSCGHVLAELVLTVRHWTCPGCRTWHDRDLNAAKNILAAGRAVTRDTVSGDACGADVRRQGSSLPQSAVKQEPRAVRHSA
jgi:transposase